VDIPVLALHGHQKQTKRTTTFFEFVNASRGTLLSTDVAARGLDIPAVDWIIQYDPPDDPKEYIHRVGRTARAGKSGRALLFLIPEELGFLKYLKQASVPLNEYEFPQSKLANIQTQLQNLIERNFYLHKSAREAYKSYLHAYASHQHKEIFNVRLLDLQKVSSGMGFSAPPDVHLMIDLTGKSGKKMIAQRGGGSRKNAKQFQGGQRVGTGGKSGHVFSASNPYGARSPGDKRQFSY